MLNGVKQGGVLSPILFCIDIHVDGLLNKLNSSLTGCCIGSQLTGALAYADDIVLLAPTAAAMRSMLRYVKSTPRLLMWYSTPANPNV